MQAVAISEDQSKVATCGRDKRVHLWDLESGELIGKMTGHTDSIESVVFVDQDTYVISCSYDFSIKCWDLDPTQLHHDHRTMDALAKLGQVAVHESSEFESSDDYAVFLGFHAMALAESANGEQATKLQSQLRQWMEENQLDQSRTMVRLLAEVDQVLQDAE